jgi:hypothetical protein
MNTRLFPQRRRTNRHRFSRKSIFEPLEPRTLLDGAGPYILSITPTEVRNGTFDHIDMAFNEAVDPTSVTTSPCLG